MQSLKVTPNKIYSTSSTRFFSPFKTANIYFYNRTAAPGCGGGGGLVLGPWDTQTCLHITHICMWLGRERLHVTSSSWVQLSVAGPSFAFGTFWHVFLPKIFLICFWFNLQMQNLWLQRANSTMNTIQHSFIFKKNAHGKIFSSAKNEAFIFVLF